MFETYSVSENKKKIAPSLKDIGNNFYKSRVYQVCTVQDCSMSIAKFTLYCNHFRRPAQKSTITVKLQLL